MLSTIMGSLPETGLFSLHKPIFDHMMPDVTKQTPINTTLAISPFNMAGAYWEKNRSSKVHRKPYLPYLLISICLETNHTINTLGLKFSINFHQIGTVIYLIYKESDEITSLLK